MRGESMKGKSKKSTYSTTFGVDPLNFIGRPRFELGTNCLKGNCSTVELSAQKLN